mgnify:CR=1 FL=1
MSSQLEAKNSRPVILRDRRSSIARALSSFRASLSRKFVMNHAMYIPMWVAAFSSGRFEG